MAEKISLFNLDIDNEAPIPQYSPRNIKPYILELCNMEKYLKFKDMIDMSGVSEEEKQFLNFAATRFIAFDYSKIADYYVYSNAKIQNLFEESSLVCIDKNDGMAKRYVELSSNIDKIISEVNNE